MRISHTTVREFAILSTDTAAGAAPTNTDAPAVATTTDVPTAFPFPTGGAVTVTGADGAAYALSEYGRVDPSDPRPLPPGRANGVNFGAHRVPVAERVTSTDELRTGARAIVYALRTGFRPDGSPSGLTSFHPLFRFPAAVFAGFIDGAYGSVRYFIAGADGTGNGVISSGGVNYRAIAEPARGTIGPDGAIPFASVVPLRGATELGREIDRSHPGYVRGDHGVYHRAIPAVAGSVIPTRPTLTVAPPTAPATDPAPTVPAGASVAGASVAPETVTTSPETADLAPTGETVTLTPGDVGALADIGIVPADGYAIESLSGPAADPIPDAEPAPVAPPTPRKNRKNRNRG